MSIKVVWILNLNNESFYDGWKYTKVESAIKKSQEMIHDGADIIEVWGFSTKPWSFVPPIEEELKRIIPTLESLNTLWFPISVETSRHEIVREVLKYENVIMINDTSGLKDKKIIELLSKNPEISYVLMHNPTEYHLSNNLDPHYENIVSEVYDFLENTAHYIKTQWCNNIIIDPWFFFHKWVKENIALIKNLHEFHKIWYPIFVAISRKSCILEIDKCASNMALIETCIMNFECMKKWASYLRVHDIKEAKHIIKLLNLYN